jgi:hypothetical protein
MVSRPASPEASLQLFTAEDAVDSVANSPGFGIHPFSLGDIYPAPPSFFNSLSTMSHASAERLPGQSISSPTITGPIKGPPIPSSVKNAPPSIFDPEASIGSNERTKIAHQLFQSQSMTEADSRANPLRRFVSVDETMIGEAAFNDEDLAARSGKNAEDGFGFPAASQSVASGAESFKTADTRHSRTRKKKARSIERGRRLRHLATHIQKQVEHGGDFTGSVDKLTIAELLSVGDGALEVSASMDTASLMGLDALTGAEDHNNNNKNKNRRRKRHQPEAGPGNQVSGRELGFHSGASTAVIMEDLGDSVIRMVDVLSVSAPKAPVSEVTADSSRPTSSSRKKAAQGAEGAGGATESSSKYPMFY